MYKEDRQSGAGFAIGIVAGAVVGAGVALLLAPRTGAELRGTLNDSMTSMRDALSRRYRDLAERAGVELEDIEARVDRAAESIENGAREVLDSVSRQRANLHRSADGPSVS